MDLRGSSIDAEVAYLDMTRGRRSDDGVYVLGPADPRTTPLRQFGLRSLGEGDGSDVDSVGKFPAVCLVIVTFDNPSLLASCLDSIAVTTAWPNLAIVVVDNGADPRTRAAVERPRGLDVRWVTSGGNIGFARAINRGAREVAGDYLVLLNDDTVMAPGCIARLVSHLEADPDLGLVCPVSNEIGNEARVQVGYHDFDTMVEESRMRACEYRGRIRSTEVVPLFCAAMRRRVFDECGGLDGRYEVGMFEDDDLSRTLRTKGYRLGIADDCFVHHVGQASFGRLSDQAYLKIWEANKARYEQKWGRRWRPPLGGEDA